MSTTTNMAIKRFLLLLCLLAAMPAMAGGFSFRDLQDKPQRLEDYRGKWVLVNFWATWCPPCLEEIPELVALHETHKNTDLVVIGVSLDSTRESVKDYVAKHRVSYPIVHGSHELIAQIGKVEALPTTYLYTPNGELVAQQTGTVTRESVESYIKSKAN